MAEFHMRKNHFMGPSSDMPNPLMTTAFVQSPWILTEFNNYGPLKNSYWAPWLLSAILNGIFPGLLGFGEWFFILTL